MKKYLAIKMIAITTKARVFGLAKVKQQNNNLEQDKHFNFISQAVHVPADASDGR